MPSLVLGTEAQRLAWTALVTRFGEAKIQNHNPEWIDGLQTWLPHYQFQAISKITDIWTEYNEGLNGFLAVRELNAVWGPKWKRNEGQIKTEAARRNKVVELIEQLMKKPRWNMQLALRFIRNRYEERMTPRAFCVHLQTKGGAGLQQVMMDSESYP
jgi:hypothetical protein